MCWREENVSKSSFNCLQMPKSCDISCLSLCSKHHPSVALNKCLSVSCSESGVRLDSAVQAESAGSGRLVELLRTSSQTEGSGFEVATRRSKRSVFLHSGVRICPQEAVSDVLASHQAYYQLRGTLISKHSYSHRDVSACSELSVLSQPLSSELWPCFRAHQHSCCRQWFIFWYFLQKLALRRAHLLNSNFPKHAFGFDWLISYIPLGRFPFHSVWWDLIQLEFIVADTAGSRNPLVKFLWRSAEGHPEAAESVFFKLWGEKQSNSQWKGKMSCFVSWITADSNVRPSLNEKASTVFKSFYGS